MAEGFNLIFTKANFLFMMNGLLMTILISIGTIFLSMIFGTILALLRHFCTGKWAWLSGLTGVYIEFFRCTPNILWILWIRFTIKGNPPGAGDLRLHAVYHRCDGRDHPRRLERDSQGTV